MTWPTPKCHCHCCYLAEWKKEITSFSGRSRPICVGRPGRLRIKFLLCEEVVYSRKTSFIECAEFLGGESVEGICLYSRDMKYRQVLSVKQILCTSDFRQIPQRSPIFF